MDLLAYQRAFVRMAFAAQPAAADLGALGTEQGAELYRHMMRTRLVGMAKVAFKASAELVGEAAFGASFARYMADAPPTSPLIREVIADYAPFARADVRLRDAAPPFLADLLWFEESKWRLGYAFAAVGAPAARREFDFTGAPCWNPILQLLTLSHPAHGYAGAPLVPEPCALLMYRAPERDDVRWYKTDAFFAALLARSQAEPARGLGELVPRVAEERALAVDQELLESLASSLTLALERGVLLGVLDRP